MPAPKPSGLNTRNDTKAEKDARVAAESALTPQQLLPKAEPVELKEHPVAAKEWRRLIRLYNSLEADIVSMLDMGMLLDYCILIEQLAELDELRKAAIEDWRYARDALSGFKVLLDRDAKSEDAMKVFIKATEAVNWAYDKIVKLDGRVDRKRALLLQLRQSLYLTPRSRAGVAPKGKQEEKPDDFGDEFD